MVKAEEGFSEGGLVTVEMVIVRVCLERAVPEVIPETLTILPDLNSHPVAELRTPVPIKLQMGVELGTTVLGK